MNLIKNSTNDVSSLWHILLLRSKTKVLPTVNKKKKGLYKRTPGGGNNADYLKVLTPKLEKLSENKKYKYSQQPWFSKCDTITSIISINGPISA